MISEYSLKLAKRKSNEFFTLRLNKVLEEKHVNGNQLAKMIGADKGRVYNWIKGNCLPNIPSLMAVCSALNVSPNYLLYGIEDSSDFNKELGTSTISQ